MSRNRIRRPFESDVDAQDVLLGIECARDTKREFLVAGLHGAGGADRILRLQRGDQRAAIDPQARELLGREFDNNLLVLRAKISILETSATRSSCARTSST